MPLPDLVNLILNLRRIRIRRQTRKRLSKIKKSSTLPVTNNTRILSRHNKITMIRKRIPDKSDISLAQLPPRTAPPHKRPKYLLARSTRRRRKTQQQSERHTNSSSRGRILTPAVPPYRSKCQSGVSTRFSSGVCCHFCTASIHSSVFFGMTSK